MASTGNRKAKGQGRLGWLRHVKFAEESVVGEGEAVLLLAHVILAHVMLTHIQTAADGHVDHLPEQLLRKSSQLGLMLGIGAGDDQARLGVEHAEMTLTVEIVLIVDRLSADQARKADHPRSGFANRRGN